MITIRTSQPQDEPVLVGLEAELHTSTGVYELSSTGPLATDAVAGLFGAISWPNSRFRLAPGVVLEQQGFLPADGSAAAFSWTLSGDEHFHAELIIRPFFSNCGPVAYRDTGFRALTDERDGRLTWLPRVLGPRFIADTNGTCREEFRDQCTENGQPLRSPGAFHFELTHRPSVLIISQESMAGSDAARSVGAFLAGLLQPDRPTTRHVHARDSEHLPALKAA